MSVDWPALLRLGHAMGIAPPSLWRLGVREWRALLAAPQPMDRAGLAALEARFPDTAVGHPAHEETADG